MSEPFIGEIHIYPYSFPPLGWADCNGQRMSIQQYSAVYAVLGSQFGGDQTSFNLPNLMSRAPMHWGQGPGLTNRNFAGAGGNTMVALPATQMPAHTHTLSFEQETTETAAPIGSYPGAFRQGTSGVALYDNNGASSPATMSPAALGISGGGQGHDNMQPYMVLRFCIALEGIFPQRE